MMNSTRQLLHQSNTGSNLVSADHPYEVATSNFETSTWQQRMNSKDSSRTNPIGIPSILMERFVQNQNISLHNKRTMCHCNNKRNNITETSDDFMDTRKFQPSPKNVNIANNMSWTIDSLNSIIPTINNMYYQEVTDDDCDVHTIRYKSASRPILRSQQEKDLMRQEEKLVTAVEHEYDMATWRMYNRIVKHRQKRPLPDRYYDEVASKVAPYFHDSMKTESNTDVIPSDLTATTTGTNSASSSPSLCSSPKFTAIQHSKSRSRIPTCVDYHDGIIDGSGFPRTVVSNIMTDYDNELSVIITNDEEESEDEYADMMMFDLEL